MEQLVCGRGESVGAEAVFRGWLLKKARARSTMSAVSGKNWRKRFFVLQEVVEKKSEDTGPPLLAYQLRYYTNSDGTGFKGSVELHHGAQLLLLEDSSESKAAGLKEKHVHKPVFALVVKSDKGPLFFEALCEGEREKWVTVLQACLQRLKEDYRQHRSSKIIHRVPTPAKKKMVQLVDDSSAVQLIAEGLLLKRAVKSGRNFKWRVFQLYPDARLIYLDPQTRTQKGILVLTQNFFCSDWSGKRHGFQISDLETTFYLAAPSASEKRFWVGAISGVLRSLNGLGNMEFMEDITSKNKKTSIYMPDPSGGVRRHMPLNDCFAEIKELAARIKRKSSDHANLSNDFAKLQTELELDTTDPRMDMQQLYHNSLAYAAHAVTFAASTQQRTTATISAVASCNAQQEVNQCIEHNEQVAELSEVMATILLDHPPPPSVRFEEDSDSSDDDCKPAPRPPRIEESFCKELDGQLSVNDDRTPPPLPPRIGESFCKEVDRQLSAGLQISSDDDCKPPPCPPRIGESFCKELDRQLSAGLQSALHRNISGGLSRAVSKGSECPSDAATDQVDAAGNPQSSLANSESNRMRAALEECNSLLGEPEHADDSMPPDTTKGVPCTGAEGMSEATRENEPHPVPMAPGFLAELVTFQKVSAYRKPRLHPSMFHQNYPSNEVPAIEEASDASKPMVGVVFPPNEVPAPMDAEEDGMPDAGEVDSVEAVSVVASTDSPLPSFEIPQPMNATHTHASTAYPTDVEPMQGTAEPASSDTLHGAQPTQEVTPATVEHLSHSQTADDVLTIAATKDQLLEGDEANVASVSPAVSPAGHSTTGTSTELAVEGHDEGHDEGKALLGDSEDQENLFSHDVKLAACVIQEMPKSAPQLEPQLEPKDSSPHDAEQQTHTIAPENEESYACNMHDETITADHAEPVSPIFTSRGTCLLTLAAAIPLLPAPAAGGLPTLPLPGPDTALKKSDNVDAEPPLASSEDAHAVEPASPAQMLMDKGASSEASTVVATAPCAISAPIENTEDCLPAMQTKDDDSDGGAEIGNANQSSESASCDLEIASCAATCPAAPGIEDGGVETSFDPLTIRGARLSSIFHEMEVTGGGATGDHNEASQVEDSTVCNSQSAQGLQALWQSREQDAMQDMKSNPFSKSFVRDTTKLPPGQYGTPVPGSRTEARARAAQEWIVQEMDRLLGIIQKLGQIDDESGCVSVSFGVLFEAYQDISDSLVGILIRAKKHGKVQYAEDMLFQGVHDHVKISLSTTI